MNIREMLTDNEKLFWEGKPNKTCYVWSKVIPQIPFAILWLMFDTAFIILMFSTNVPTGMLFFIIPFFALHLMPVWIVIGSLIKNKLEYPNVVYAITDKRIIIKDGLIGVDFKSIDYAEIDHLSVNVNILEKIKNVGTLIVKVNNSSYNLQAIEHVYEIFKRLQKISLDVKTDINYPNANRPANNPGYNTDYEEKNQQ